MRRKPLQNVPNIANRVFANHSMQHHNINLANPRLAQRLFTSRTRLSHFDDHRHPKPYPSSQSTKVWTTGMNMSGQLGTGELPRKNEYNPVVVEALNNKEVILVGCGAAHAMAVTSNGDLYTWGTGKQMQLGTSSPDDVFVPVRVAEATAHFGKDRPQQALGNGVTSVILTESGTPFIWGTSERIDDVHPHITPYRPLQSFGTIKSIAAGWGHYLACNDRGQLFAWGWNQHGQLGDGSTTNQKTPQRVPMKAHIVSVAAGQDHSIAITDKGAVYAWGSCRHGQLGLGVEAESVPTPTLLHIPEKIHQAACGTSHTLLLSELGNVWAFGWNSSGQTGLLDEGAVVNAPVPVTTLDGVAVRISAGRLHSACITEQLHAWTWGHGLATGLGGPNKQPLPDCVEALHLPNVDIIDAVCGHDFTVFITRELPPV